MNITDLNTRVVIEQMVLFNVSLPFDWLQARTPAPFKILSYADRGFQTFFLARTKPRSWFSWRTSPLPETIFGMASLATHSREPGAKEKGMFVHFLASDGTASPWNTGSGPSHANIRWETRQTDSGAASLELEVVTDRGMLAAICHPSNEFPCYLPSGSIFDFPGLAYTYYNDLRMAYVPEPQTNFIHTIQLAEASAAIDVWPLKHLELDRLDINGWGLNREGWEQLSTPEPAYVVGPLKRHGRWLRAISYPNSTITECREERRTHHEEALS